MKIKTFIHFRIFLFATSAATLLLIVWLGYRSFISSSNRIDNILLISIDTMRADYLGCYGYPKDITPNIDKIAAEGILFENVISPVPLTLPSHSSMMTGIIPPSHGVHDNKGYKLGDSHVTLAEVLQEKGFMTGAIVSAFVLDSRFGLNQGFETYYDDFEEPLNARSITERKGMQTTRIANSWLEEHFGDKFFLFLHYYDPHFPYKAPEPFGSKFKSSSVSEATLMDKAKQVPAKYAGEISYVDHYIGQVIDKLKKLKLYDSTLIIITSDHGEMLREHDETSHGYFIYQSAIKVPLIFKLPRKSKSARIKQTVGLVDIMPTICTLLGIETQQKFNGIDLLRYLSKKDTDEIRHFYCESFLPTMYKANSLFGVVTDTWKYIQTTRPELYDLRNDPEELNNLVNEQKHRARLLQDKLKEILEESVPDKTIDSKITLDKESRAKLESLGYLASSMIVESFEFDQTRKDPKDLVNFHSLNSNLNLAFNTRQYKFVKFLCERMLQEDPTYVAPYYFLGTVAYEERDYNKAVEYLSRCIEGDSQTPELFNNLGLAFFHLKRHDEAVKNFDLALQFEPDSMQVHYNLGREFSRVGKFDEAIPHLRKALQLAPDDEDVNRELDRALTARQKTEEALKHYHDILQDQPNSPEAHNGLANIYLRQGKKDLALEHCNKALEADPEPIGLRLRLADMFFALGQGQLALAQYHRLLKVKPDSVNVLNSLAWILATSEDQHIHSPTDAVKYAQQACELTNYKNPGIIDTLAAAYAAAGKFELAIETAQKAIEVANSKGRNDLAGRIQKRLNLYRQGKTYLDPQLIPSN